MRLRSSIVRAVKIWCVARLRMATMRPEMLRFGWVIALTAASACVALTPAGARVAVYRAPLQEPRDRMPDGCRLVSAAPPVSLTELEIDGQKDPYVVQRNRAASAGANALLVRSQVLVGRRNLDCPGSSPITDCPPDSGAWFRVVFESYACSAGALRLLGPQ
jgi:hypothetical protein